MRLRLDRAVELEDFEAAAELRDQINVLEAAER
ncbi:MAG: UvrB/UvrC motif-containing protein [Gemmatimonadales bacterium]